MIDPAPYTFSSFFLDLAKIEAWKIRHGLKTEDYSLLAIAETIRTLKYAPEKYQSKLYKLCSQYLKS